MSTSYKPTSVYKLVHQTLRADPAIVRYLNAVEVRCPKRTPAAMTREACAVAYAPSLFAEHSQDGVVYVGSLSYVDQQLWEHLQSQRVRAKTPMSKLVKDALISWFRAHVYGIMSFGDSEQVVFVWDDDAVKTCVIDRVV